MDKTKIVVTAIIAVVIITGAWLIAKGFTNFREGEPNINVTGMAEKQITSDLIVWKISVSADGSARSSAFSEYEKTAKTMRRYLNKLTKDFYNEEQRRYFTIDNGYSVSQTFIISSHDLNTVERIYQKISELYNEGINFNSYTPAYYYTKLNDLKMEMLNKASANAYERAQTIAKGSDASVGSLVSSSMGVFQIVGLNSDEEYSWGGTFNTSSKEKVASITVRTTYRVK